MSRTPSATPSPSQAAKSTTDPVGDNVRAARLAARLTVADLANRVGVSQPFITQIEGGISRPSLASLYRMSDALGVTPGTLLRTGGLETSVVRRSRSAEYSMKDGPHSPTARLMSAAGGRTEAYEFLIGPDDDVDEEFCHPGEEITTVRRGILHMTVGDEHFELGPGDSIHFDSARPHRWSIPGSEPVELLLFVAHP